MDLIKILMQTLPFRDHCWIFELHFVLFFRYLVCLQIRKDIVTGKWVWIFFSFSILGGSEGLLMLMHWQNACWMFFFCQRGGEGDAVAQSIMPCCESYCYQLSECNLAGQRTTVQSKLVSMHLEKPIKCAPCHFSQVSPVLSSIQFQCWCGWSPPSKEDHHTLPLSTFHFDGAVNIYTKE